jgi:PleD family two-component response regulator
MWNLASAPEETRTAREVARTAATQRVVIVNGSSQVLELLESVLEAGHYDVVFVESNEHAYSQIKRVQPHLVILCVHIDDLDGFQVLSMLKLDEATKAIPVLTYTTEFDAAPEEDARGEVDTDTALFAPPLAERMN